MEGTKELITTDAIRSKVYILRGQQVMLDQDLAEIYGYQVKNLNQQVKRNLTRFPEDFMFQLTKEEVELVKSQFVTSRNKCDYKKQVHEEMLDASVAEVISKLVSNPKFSDLIRNKINMEVDTSALDQEIENYKIQLRKLYHNKDTILSDMDSLDYEDKHYQRRKTDLENRLYKTYDKIDEAEELLISAKTKKNAKRMVSG